MFVHMELINIKIINILIVRDIKKIELIVFGK